MIHKQKYMQFSLKSYCFRSMLHHYLHHCLFCSFSEKICKTYKGPIFLNIMPNRHRPFSSSRAILAGQQLKKALMCLGMQPGKKVYSCDVDMASTSTSFQVEWKLHFVLPQIRVSTSNRK